tara:strand:+ start:799 stop:1095 length:297 start_codon:yes stop_codon:yes gene_type:complete
MTSINDSIQHLQNELSAYQSKPSKVGATRLRKCLMDVSKACSVTRKEVLADVKLLPVKTRVKKEKLEELSEEPSGDELQELPLQEKPAKKTRQPKTQK